MPQTRDALTRFVQETEYLLLNSLTQYDKNASCKITPSLDLGFPHDVERIAGGFPTGCLVTWESSVPYIPIDTTVNVCTTSVYTLSAPLSEFFSTRYIENILDSAKSGSYIPNFHRGNHFIVIAKNSKQQEILLLHSSAAEFKRQFNGLYPTRNNWYDNDVKVYQNNNRYIRYIVDRPALLFYAMAKQLVSYNETRHNFFAELLVEKNIHISSVKHCHHYDMPSRSSVLIGSYLIKERETVPVLSRPGKPILIYTTLNPKHKHIVNGETMILVPHGWGKTCSKYPNIKIDSENNRFSLNDNSYEIEPGASLRDHPDLMLRDYSFDTQLNKYKTYEDELINWNNGTIDEYWHQVCSYNKNGFQKWTHSPKYLVV